MPARVGGVEHQRELGLLRADPARSPSRGAVTDPPPTGGWPGATRSRGI